MTLPPGIDMLILLALLLMAVLPSWPYSRRWGLWPGCIVGLLLAVVMFLRDTGDL